MKRIYYRLNWKEYLNSGNKKNESTDELYSLLFSEIKSAISKNLNELCITADAYTRTMILVPYDEDSQLLEECINYFQIKENYEKCIEIKKCQNEPLKKANTIITGLGLSIYGIAFVIAIMLVWI